MRLDVIAEAIVPNRAGVNGVRRCVEAIEWNTRTGEGRLTAETDIHRERAPAVEHRRPHGNAIQATGGYEGLPKKCIERTDKIRMPDNTVKSKRAALR